MNLLEQTKKICRFYEIKPSRKKGQNFLINEDIYNKIIEIADLKKDDIVLEVGSGLGFLTEKLAVGADNHQPVQKVIAVELDDKLAEILKIRLIAEKIKNVEVVNGNILDLGNRVEGIGSDETTPPLAPLDGGDNTPPAPLFRGELTHPSPLPGGEYKVVANLPYNITSIFLRKFLSLENKPEIMVLMIQREVAERITAGAGEMSLLAVSVQFYADAEIVEYVNKNNFWPEPEVESALIKLKIKNQKSKINEKEFFKLVKIGFSARRKMLKNNLANGFHIKASEAEEAIKSAGFSQNIRAQELSVEDWKKLLPYFSK